MAVAFDAVAAMFHGVAATAITNTGLTIGSISNGVLLVLLSFDAAVTSLMVQWDTTGTLQNMTQIGTKASSDNLSFSYLFGLLAPHTGNKTLSVAWVGPTSYAGTSVSFSGADQTAFATTFKNLATDASTVSSGNYPATGLSITTISGDMAVMVASTHAGGFSTGGGLGTQIGWSNLDKDADGRYLAASGASTVVAANENTSSAPCCAVGCAIAAVGNIADILAAQACL